MVFQMSKTATTVFKTMSRGAGLIALGLGYAYWAQYEVPLPVHMAFGLLVVIAIWGLAAQLRKTAPGLAAAAVLWGILVPVLALAQLFVPVYLQMEEAQTVLRFCHVVVGLCSIGFAEILAGRVRRAIPL